MSKLRYPRTIRDLEALRCAVADLAHLPGTTSVFIKLPNDDGLVDLTISLIEDDGPGAPAFVVFDDNRYAYQDLSDDLTISEAQAAIGYKGPPDAHYAKDNVR